MISRNEWILFDDGVLSYYKPPGWKHAYYGTFSAGLIPMEYALVSVLFSPVSVSGLWVPFLPILTHMS